MPRPEVRWPGSMATDGTAELLLHNEPVLIAALVASATSREQMSAALGFDAGLAEHRYAAGLHTAPGIEVGSLAFAIDGHLGADPGAGDALAARATAAGETLIEACRAVADISDGLGAALERFASAVALVVPFVIAAPPLRQILARRAGAPGSPWEPEIAREVRDCFAIAAVVAGREEARELVCNRAPRFAMPLIEQQVPDIAGLIARHVERYGWLGTHGGAYDSMTTKAVIERLQKMVLRFPAEVIAQAAAPPAPGPGGALGAVQSLPWFRPDALVQALALVRPLVIRVAHILGCSTAQVEACSVGELVAALAGGAPLPVAEADRRIENGFVVERSSGEVRIAAEDSPVPVRPGGYRPAVVTGQSVALGRAVGRVRILTEAVELGDLEWGDVLVTAASTPDRMGVESAFPERGGSPPGIERAAAIVADEGGLLSHAAILSRELGIPCVLGTETGTRTLHDGQYVEVDATKEQGTVIPFDA
ncbi:MAG TPA: PEP-utilizing enzyme [Actinomycetota bacterium]|nr:PEP-utilizing enzyme [Actinomycetota bacterium]